MAIKVTTTTKIHKRLIIETPLFEGFLSGWRSLYVRVLDLEFLRAGAPRVFTLGVAVQAAAASIRFRHVPAISTAMASASALPTSEG
jgi:hypothetical protein